MNLKKMILLMIAMCCGVCNLYSLTSDNDSEKLGENTNSSNHLVVADLNPRIGVRGIILWQI